MLIKKDLLTFNYSNWSINFSSNFAWNRQINLLTKFQTTNWMCWLLIACICLVEARYKIRRPPLPPPQPAKLMFKKSWPITHRISVGNTMHINGNFPLKRITHKPSNYRWIFENIYRKKSFFIERDIFSIYPLFQNSSTSNVQCAIYHLEKPDSNKNFFK